MNGTPAPSILIVVPVFNHGRTLRSVVEGVLLQRTDTVKDVLVVDDGSTDGGAETLDGLPVLLVRHPQNSGKGTALVTAARKAAELGCTHILTLDADGQHHPEDIPLLADAAARNPAAVIVGARRFEGEHVPAASRFGRAFSAFWMLLQTGMAVSDMQSGFRVYPLECILSLSHAEPRFAFEIEVLVRAAWAGFAILEVPVSVSYPPPDERISHFDKFRDNVRISLLNTRLTIRALLPVPFRRCAAANAARVSVLHPVSSLRLLLADNSTPSWLGLSAAVGMALSTLPLPGLQCLLLLYAIGRWKLNRLCALAVIPLAWPPFIPGLAVLLGYRLRHGIWLTEFSIQTLGHEIGQRFGDWILGGIALTPVAGGILGCLVWGLAQFLRKRLVSAGDTA